MTLNNIKHELLENMELFECKFSQLRNLLSIIFLIGALPLKFSLNNYLNIRENQC